MRSPSPGVRVSPRAGVNTVESGKFFQFYVDTIEGEQ
jgi:hypothetical protein